MHPLETPASDLRSCAALINLVLYVFSTLQVLCFNFLPIRSRNLSPPPPTQCNGDVEACHRMLLAKEREGYSPELDSMSSFTTAYPHPPVSIQAPPQEGYVPYRPVDAAASSPAVARSNTHSPYHHHHHHQADVNLPPHIADVGVPNNAHVPHSSAQRPELHRVETYPTMSHASGEVDPMASWPVSGHQTAPHDRTPRYSVPSSVYHTPTSTMAQPSWTSTMPRATSGQHALPTVATFF